MTAMDKNQAMGETSKGFTIDDLVSLKEKLLDLEKTIDAITVKNAEAGETFDGAYIFELLAKSNVRLFDSHYDV